MSGAQGNGGIAGAEIGPGRGAALASEYRGRTGSTHRRRLSERPLPTSDEDPTPMIRLLLPQLQRFAWGSPTAIPEILGIDVDGSPLAEA